MMFQPEHLAPAIRAGRNALNWTQQELSEKSGLSLPTVARIETSNNPKMETVLALFRVMANHGVSFKWEEQGFAMNANFLQKQLTTTD